MKWFGFIFLAVVWSSVALHIVSEWRDGQFGFVLAHAATILGLVALLLIAHKWKAIRGLYEAFVFWIAYRQSRK